MLSRLLVVLLIELADQLLEDRAHRVVVDHGRRKVDVGIEKLVDQRADGVGLGVFEDVMDVRREAVEVILEVGKELLLAAARFEVTDGEFRGVVEGVTRRPAERGPLLGDARLG